MMTNEEKLAQLNLWNKNTLMETLQIVFTDLGDDYLVGTMPVILEFIGHQVYCMVALILHLQNIFGDMKHIEQFAMKSELERQFKAEAAMI